MAVLTAPERIRVPTSTTKAWNSSRDRHGPDQVHGQAADQVVAVLASAHASGIITDARKAVPAGEQHAVDADDQCRRACRFFSLGCAISRLTCASVSSPLMASTEWPKAMSTAMTPKWASRCPSASRGRAARALKCRFAENRPGADGLALPGEASRAHQTRSDHHHHGDHA